MLKVSKSQQKLFKHVISWRESPIKPDDWHVGASYLSTTDLFFLVEVNEGQNLVDSPSRIFQNDFVMLMLP